MPIEMVFLALAGFSAVLGLSDSDGGWAWLLLALVLAFGAVGAWGFNELNAVEVTE